MIRWTWVWFAAISTTIVIYHMAHTLQVDHDHSATMHANPGIAWAYYWHRLGAAFVAIPIAGMALGLARASKEPQLRQVGWMGC